MSEGQPKLEIDELQEGGLRLFDAPPEVDVIASLVSRYMVPPFTILDRRQGYWQERGKQWKGLGIESELGRGEGLTFNTGTMSKDMAGGWSGSPSNGAASATSIFDPVICEIAYNWLCAAGGLVVDPFAGGSVRGIIAAASGRRYAGIDLSGPQVEANRQQADRIFAARPDDGRPTWIEGDSRQVMQRTPAGTADLIFTCPPYGSLEVYSDDPADLSNMAPEEFADAYGEIIAAAVRVLRDNRFAAIVVGNYRGKDGMLHDLGGLTTRAFTAAGARLYNDAVIIDPVGTAAVRSRQFAASRKLVRVHQQLLIFVKGDPKKATAAIGVDNE